MVDCEKTDSLVIRVVFQHNKPQTFDLILKGGKLQQVFVYSYPLKGSFRRQRKHRTFVICIAFFIKRRLQIMINIKNKQKQKKNKIK